MSSITILPADSTQSDLKDAKNKKHRKKDLNKRKRKKDGKKRRSGNDSGSDYESDLDLSRELKPISGYLRDRDLTIEHMFRSISGKKLKAMLPELLKPILVDELKRLCVEELECMSRKRIRRILQGANPETISSSGTDEESSLSDEDHEKHGSSDEYLKSDVDVASTSHKDLGSPARISHASDSPRSYGSRSRSRSPLSRSRSGSNSAASGPNVVSRRSSCNSQDLTSDSDAYANTSEDEVIEEVVYEEVILDEGEDIESIINRGSYVKGTRDSRLKTVPAHHHDDGDDDDVVLIEREERTEPEVIEVMDVDDNDGDVLDHSIVENEAKVPTINDPDGTVENQAEVENGDKTAPENQELAEDIQDLSSIQTNDTSSKQISSTADDKGTEAELDDQEPDLNKTQHETKSAFLPEMSPQKNVSETNLSEDPIKSCDNDDVCSKTLKESKEVEASSQHREEIVDSTGMCVIIKAEPTDKYTSIPAITNNIDQNEMIMPQNEDELEEGELADTSSEDEIIEGSGSDTDVSEQEVIEKPPKSQKTKVKVKRPKKKIRVIKRIIKVIRRKPQQEAETETAKCKKTKLGQTNNSEIPKDFRNVPIKQEPGLESPVSKSKIKMKSSGSAPKVKNESSKEICLESLPNEEASLNKMEILELEMRARAIKAMLKKQEIDDEKPVEKKRKIKLKR